MARHAKHVRPVKMPAKMPKMPQGKHMMGGKMMGGKHMMGGKPRKGK